MPQTVREFPQISKMPQMRKMPYDQRDTLEIPLKIKEFPQIKKMPQIRENLNTRVIPQMIRDILHLFCCATIIKLKD